MSFQSANVIGHESMCLQNAEEASPQTRDWKKDIVNEID